MKTILKLLGAVIFTTIATYGYIRMLVIPGFVSMIIFLLGVGAATGLFYWAITGVLAPKKKVEEL